MSPSKYFFEEDPLGLEGVSNNFLLEDAFDLEGVLDEKIEC
jgi:hypothetical protein